LFFTQFGVIFHVMRHWSARKLFALLLAVFIAAGISVSVAQASSMTVTMATMSEMDMSDHGDCQDCPDQPGDNGMNACGVVCATAVFAVLPAATLMPAPRKLAFSAARDPLLRGRALLPDPYPPRTSDIG
jgi:phosphotransferase system  glucose/maltose/N-acetylglucosamine-specific IIC component